MGMTISGEIVPNVEAMSIRAVQPDSDRLVIVQDIFDDEVLTASAFWREDQMKWFNAHTGIELRLSDRAIWFESLLIGQRHPGVMGFDFQPGDIVSYAGDEYTVVANFGATGKVKPAGEDIVIPFCWRFEGEDTVLVRRHKSGSIKS